VTEHPPPPGELVLVIEDNDQNRYLATFLLERRGYAVRTAPDGPSGIEAAESLEPAVILLDIQLPGMDGYDVARELRRRPSLGHTPIIAVTSYAMVGDREKCLAAGCTGYIEKPIDPEVFVDQIDAIRSAAGTESRTREEPS
jgi:CheY-like chemotaxis protein